MLHDPVFWAGVGVGVLCMSSILATLIVWAAAKAGGDADGEEILPTPPQWRE